MSASFRKGGEEKADTITLTDIIRPYGVGIDTHSKFIAVCVLLKEEKNVVRYEKNFPTAWASMLMARDWVESKLPNVLSPVTSKPASRGRIKTSHSEGLYSYQVS